GACDVAESCTGSSAACPGDSFVSSTTVCRSAAGACDVAENCTGSSAACPSDSFVSSTTVCRSSAGICDVAESCTGSSAACPTDCGRLRCGGDLYRRERRLPGGRVRLLDRGLPFLRRRL